MNEVVPHEQLLLRVKAIAAAIVDNDPIGVRQMLATYAAQEQAELGEVWDLESAGKVSFRKTATPGAEVAARRDAIMERGRSQL